MPSMRGHSQCSQQQMICSYLSCFRIHVSAHTHVHFHHIVTHTFLPLPLSLSLPGDPDLLQLLTSHGADPGVPAAKPRTIRQRAIHFGCRCAHRAGVRNREAVTKCAFGRGSTPLHRAAFYCQLSAVTALMRHPGTSPETRNMYPRHTPLQVLVCAWYCQSQRERKRERERKRKELLVGRRTSISTEGSSGFLTVCNVCAVLYFADPSRRRRL
jgi:hypothetical protein